jgi:hypothetical protein
MIDNKSIMDAYAHIRATNNTIPDDVLDFMKNAAVDALNPIVFDDGTVKLALGDSVTFLPPDKDDVWFWNSNAGEKMTKGVNDKIHITVKQKPWLSIYYEITISKNGKLVTQCEYDNAMYPDDQEDENESNSHLYTEQDDTTMFLRYVIGKGAKKD